MSETNHHEHPAAPAVEELQPLFAKYQIERLIAVGGMGAVYEAEQISLERKVAIKVLPREFSSDEQFRLNFRQEAKVMAKVIHPNVVSIFDSGEVDGLLYLVMEFVDGNSLHDLAAGQKIDQLEAAKFAQSICAGLQHAHELGLIHRDIKPANILVNSKGVPKITDFGLAGQMNERPDGPLMGTPQYLAPELIRREGAVDQRADIYSLCVIFYELLTGTTPGDDYVAASAISDVDTGFDEILAKGLHPNPALRTHSAEELSAQIDKVVQAMQQNGEGNSGATNRLVATSASRKTTGVVLSAAQTSSNVAKVVTSPRSAASMPTLQSSKSSGGKMNGVAVVVVLLAVGGLIWAGMNASSNKSSDLADDAPTRTPADDSASTEQTESSNSTPAPDSAAGEKGKARFGSSISIDRPNREVQKIKDQLFINQTAIQFGERDSLPDEAIEVGGRYFLLIDEKMTWFKALKFCERFNAQLACLHGEANLDWLVESGLADQTASTSVWCGAYSSGNLEDPAWIDSGIWTVDPVYVPNAESSEQRFLAASLNARRLEPTSGNEELPFIMEFKKGGGEAPGAYEAQLMRVKGALERGVEPQWPAGAVIANGRCFTMIESPGTWQGARISARNYGAKLAVIDEAGTLEAIGPLLRLYMRQTGRAWIGGRFELGQGWMWEDGPDWDFAPWADGQPAKFGQRSVGLQLIAEDRDMMTFKFKAEGAKEQAEFFVMSWDLEGEE